jgi:hypothetical protein
VRRATLLVTAIGVAMLLARGVAWPLPSTAPPGLTPSGTHVAGDTKLTDADQKSTVGFP